MIQADDAHATNCHLPPEIFNIPSHFELFCKTICNICRVDAGPGDPPLRVGIARTGLKTCVRGDGLCSWRMIDFFAHGCRKTSNEMITSVIAACKRKNASTLADVCGPAAQRDLVKWQRIESIGSQLRIFHLLDGQQFQNPAHTLPARLR